MWIPSFWHVLHFLFLNKSYTCTKLMLIVYFICQTNVCILTHFTFKTLIYFMTQIIETFRLLRMCVSVGMLRQNIPKNHKKISRLYIKSWKCKFTNMTTMTRVASLIGVRNVKFSSIIMPTFAKRNFILAFVNLKKWHACYYGYTYLFCSIN